MRPLLLAAGFAVVASPAMAFCSSAGVGDLPTQIADQTATMLCQQQELKLAADAQFRQLQLEAQLQQQQILLEEQFKLQQQQLAALGAPLAP